MIHHFDDSNATFMVDNNAYGHCLLPVLTAVSTLPSTLVIGDVVSFEDALSQVAIQLFIVTVDIHAAVFEDIHWHSKLSTIIEIPYKVQEIVMAPSSPPPIAY